jgi:hypothetical protein
VDPAALSVIPRAGVTERDRGAEDAALVAEWVTPRVLEVLRDALEPFAVAAFRDDIIEQALETARLTQVPTHGPALRDFVEGCLADSVESILGPDKADLFGDSIERVLHAAAVEYESAIKKVRARVRPLVLVASMDPARSEELEKFLASRANVEHLPDPEVIHHVLAAGVVSAIVIDCTSVPLDSGAISDIAASAGTHSRVLLWGASKEIEAAFHAEGARGVIGCAATAHVRHVAMLTLALVDEMARG